MTNREYLSQALNLQKEIDQLESELSDGYVSPQFERDRVQKTPVNSAENQAIRYIELNERIDELIRQKRKLLVEITDVIETVPDARLRIILHKRYIQGISIRLISREMHYDEKYMYSLIRLAENMIKW